MSMSNEELAKGFAERFDKNESKILEFEKKLGDFHNFFKVMNETGERMTSLITKMEEVINVVESHERDLKVIANQIETIKKDGVKTDSLSPNGTIDYDKLVNKLVKACQDIIQNEIQFAIKNK